MLTSTMTGVNLQRNVVDIFLSMPNFSVYKLINNNTMTIIEEHKLWILKQLVSTK